MHVLQQELSGSELSDEALRQEAHGTIEQLRAHITNTVELDPFGRDLLIGSVALGAMLMEGEPGTGKTEISKLLARAIGGNFRRIQGTPDLQPGDIVGSRKWHPGKFEYIFEEGPALEAHVLLCDEVNRSSPRTQSALLEVMSEQQVTVAGTTYEAMDPFTVFAAQNPKKEEEGTSPLPLALLDRFNVYMDTTQTRDIELKILQRQFRNAEIKPTSALEPERIARLRKAVTTVAISDESLKYLLDVRDVFVDHSDLLMGRSVLHGRVKTDVGRAAQYHALARSEGEANVTKEDLIFGAQAAFPHRIQLTRSAIKQEIEPQHIIEQAIAAIKYRG